MERNSLFSVLIMLLFLPACTGGGEQEARNGSGQPPSGDRQPAGETESSSLPGEPGAPATTGERIFYVSDEENQSVGTVYLDEPVSVTFGESVFDRSCDRAEKCKYKSRNTALVYEIRYKDDGFKLRDEQANLIWKVKIRDDKIKIARDEEMTRPYEIKWDGEKAKVKQDEEETGKADFGSAGLPVVVSDADSFWYITGQTKEPASAVLAIKEMEPDHQLIIFAELVLFRP